MFFRLTMSQKLQALFSQHNLPGELKAAVNSFRKIFAVPEQRGTLFTNLLPSSCTVDPLHPPVRRTILCDATVSLLEAHYNSCGVVPYGEVHTSYKLKGVNYTTHSVSPRNSYVIFSPNCGTWEAGRVQLILSHEHHKASQNLVSVFVIVEPFQSLSAKHRRFDYYRQFSGVGGRLFYTDCLKDRVLLPIEDITCHFAYTPYSSPQIDRECFHALPLNRVSS